MLSTTSNALVYQHLLKVAPEIAAEFRNCYECYPSQTNVNLKDLVSSYNTTIFANSLVYKHLCKESPSLVKDFRLQHTTYDESLDNIVVLYEKINSERQHGDNFGKRSETKLKAEETKNEAFVEGEFSDTDLLVEELEKYYPCFAFPESESEIEDDISIISQVETSSKIKCTKNREPQKNKLVTDLSEEDVSGFCHILDCEIYKDLQVMLGNDSILDKLASHILKKNILVRKIHQKLTTTNSKLHSVISSEILTNGTIKFGHFNPKENSLIETNWNKLLEESNLGEFVEDALDIFRPALTRKTLKDSIKCNVIGLYLSTGMAKVRYTSDVFAQAKIVLTAKSRKLTVQEKNFLVEYIGQHGENCDWKELAYTLYQRHVRNGASIIKKVYFAMKNVGKRGTFKIEEDKIILDLIFSENRYNAVNSDSFKEPADFLNVLSKQLNNRRQMSIYRHWYAYLKPLLLQYHAGTLHLNIKNLFLNYLNEKKVMYLQDIQWSEVLIQPQFAGHTRLSLTTEFNNMKNIVFRIKKCEITVPQMVEFMNDKYRLVKGNENVMNGKRWQRTNQIIKYYKNLVDQKS